MGFGKLTPSQAEVLRPFIEGRQVHDLGAGDLTLASRLLTLGADGVVAVEPHAPKKHPPQIEVHPTYFADYAETPEVAFVSWPVNYDGIGLVKVLRRAPVVIYLGVNTDGTSCGGSDLWEHLRKREVLAHAPHPQNTLIVYGPKRVRRPLYGEEWAAIDQSRIYRYSEAEALIPNVVER